MSNRLLADRLRFENSEQFTILVRMHLSFELDLNTEEFENEPEDRGGIFRKLNRLHRKAKGCASSVKTSSPTDARKHAPTPEMLRSMEKLMNFLEEEQNIVQEGIFRRTGALSRQADLKNDLTQGQNVDFAAGTFTVHDCASVLKAFLAELPEPLLTDAYHSAHCQLAQLMATGGTTDGLNGRLTNSLQLLFLLLPDENRQLLERLLALLNHTTHFQDKNKMSPSSLATLFTPHLICPRKLSPEALHAMSQQMSPVVAFMITMGSSLFEIPNKLATDIQAYFAEQTKKRSLTPGQVLEESVDSTAATVFSFVDREKTAQAHNSNYTTDTALAQLYAHIQSLPESSRKRKLIKQFNKENGQGTPLMMNREKSAKLSLGDSIKRHIFQRSLISRTPKRVRTPLRNISETPPHPYSTEKRPQTRVLFQTLQLAPSPPPALPVTPVTAQKSPQFAEKSTKSVDEDVPPRLSRKFPSEPNLWCGTKHGILEESGRSQSLSNVASEKCMRLNGKIGEVCSLNHSDESSDRSLISPITKSTRRMPKYMQESIMTPRSRKPVMLLGATLGGSVSDERSQQLDDCDFREEDEDEYASSDKSDDKEGTEALTSPFRDYLFTRSVLTASPADLSFSSQPGDFGSATDIRDLSESEMSESLLFCLDGNQPQGVDLSTINEEDLPAVGGGVVTKKRCLHATTTEGLDETSL